MGCSVHVQDRADQEAHSAPKPARAAERLPWTIAAPVIGCLSVALWAALWEVLTVLV